MDTTKFAHAAPGGPGMPPRWTRGSKEAVGTAYSTASRVWYTVAAGILTEVYYPTIDTPQIRDLQYLITDGRTFFHDERRNTTSSIDCVDDASLGFEIVNVSDERRYTLRKTLIGHPHQDCVLMRTRVEAAPDILKNLQLYVLCAPHLEIAGWHNNAEVVDTKAGRIIVAFKGGTWMALGATAPLTRRSCGYVAVNDGWTDLHDNRTLDWQYEAAYDGNIAVTAQIDLTQSADFALGLALATRATGRSPRCSNRWLRRSRPTWRGFVKNGAGQPGASRWRSVRRSDGQPCSTSAASICCWRTRTSLTPAR